MEQLTQQGIKIKEIIRNLEFQRSELELCILKEPTGYPREEMTSANILLLEVIRNHLSNIV